MGMMSMFLQKYGSKSQTPVAPALSQTTTTVLSRPSVSASTPLDTSVPSDFVAGLDILQNVASDMDKLIKKYAGSDEYFFYNGTVKLRFDSKLHCYYRVTGDDIILIPGVTTVLDLIDKSGPLTQWAANECAKYVLAAWDALPPGVVAVLVPDRDGMRRWLEETTELARKEFREISKRALDVGKIAHDWLDKYALCSAKMTPFDFAFPENMQARNCVYAALGWIAAHRVKFLANEFKIYSRLHEFAGTADWLAYVSSCNDPECCPTKFSEVLSIGDWKSSRHLYREYRYQTAAYKLARMEEYPDQVIEDRWVLQLGKDDGVFAKWHLPGEESFQQDATIFLKVLAAYKDLKAQEEEEKAVKRAAKAEAKAEKEVAKEAEKIARKVAREVARDERRAAKALLPKKKRTKKVAKPEVVSAPLPVVSSTFMNVPTE